MKKISIVFLSILIASSILILSVGAISGNLNLGIEFGLKKEPIDLEFTGTPLEHVQLKTDNDEPEIATKVQTPSQDQIKLFLNESFWFKTIKSPDKLKYIEIPPLNSTEIDIDNQTAPYNPPEIYHPSDNPIVIVDDGMYIFDNDSMPIIDPDVITGTGIIQYATDDFIGDFYGILSDSGNQYIPSNLPFEFKKDGLSVRFTVKQPEIQSLIVYTGGIPVDVIEIEIQN